MEKVINERWTDFNVYWRTYRHIDRKKRKNKRQKRVKSNCKNEREVEKNEELK